ncbi:hypothetical protein Tco_1338198 [Tanacetum coccineum]
MRLMNARLVELYTLEIVVVQKGVLKTRLLSPVTTDSFNNHQEKEFDLEDILQIQDVILREKLLNISRLITNIESLNDNPTPDHIILYLNLSLLAMIWRRGREVQDTTHAIKPYIPKYDSFLFEIEPDQGELTNVVIEEVDTFLVPEDSIPPGIESNFDPGGGEIVVSQNVEDDDSFTFVIRTFLPFLTYPVDSPLLLSTGSEDTIFDPRNLTLRAGSASLWEWKLSCALMFIQTLMISSD